jgi:hypothetical protein
MCSEFFLGHYCKNSYGCLLCYRVVVAIFLGVQMLDEQMPWHMQWLVVAFLMVTLLVDAVLLLLKREMDSHTGTYLLKIYIPVQLWLSYLPTIFRTHIENDWLVVVQAMNMP